MHDVLLDLLYNNDFLCFINSSTWPQLIPNINKNCTFIQFDEIAYLYKWYLG